MRFFAGTSVLVEPKRAALNMVFVVTQVSIVIRLSYRITHEKMWRQCGAAETGSGRLCGPSTQCPQLSRAASLTELFSALLRHGYKASVGATRGHHIAVGHAPSLPTSLLRMSRPLPRPLTGDGTGIFGRALRGLYFNCP